MGLTLDYCEYDLFILVLNSSEETLVEGAVQGAFSKSA